MPQTNLQKLHFWSWYIITSVLQMKKTNKQANKIESSEIESPRNIKQQNLDSSQGQPNPEHTLLYTG